MHGSGTKSLAVLEPHMFYNSTTIDVIIPRVRNCRSHCILLFKNDRWIIVPQMTSNVLLTSFCRVAICRFRMILATTFSYKANYDERKC